MDCQVVPDDGIRISYSLRGAKGNPEMEAFFSRFKTENRGLPLDCLTLDELTVVVAARLVTTIVAVGNSTIGYGAPLSYAEITRAQP